MSSLLNVTRGELTYQGLLVVLELLLLQRTKLLFGQMVVTFSRFAWKLTLTLIGNYGSVWFERGEGREGILMDERDFLMRYYVYLHSLHPRIY